MTVSTNYPTAALNGTTVPTAATSLAGASPLGAYGSQQSNVGALNAALAGAQTAGATAEQTALASAISQMRQAGVSDAEINQQLLAMQAQAAPSASAAVAAPTAATAAHKATVAKKATVKKHATVAKAKAKAKPKAKAKAKVAAKPKAAAAVTPVAGAATAGAATTLPANATQLPGGTVYSYADPNNAGLAGLQGLTPQQQLALGIMPNGLANGLSNVGQPQSNITNQSNVDPDSLLGISGLNGLVGLGGVPMAGAPILGNNNLSTPARTSNSGAPTTDSAPPSGSQTVTNRNANDNSGFSQGVDPYGSMYGGYGIGGYGGYGGVTPYNTGIAGGLYSPYGASMTGAALTGTTNSGGIMGWLGRLFS